MYRFLVGRILYHKNERNMNSNIYFSFSNDVTIFYTFPKSSYHGPLYNLNLILVLCCLEELVPIIGIVREMTGWGRGGGNIPNFQHRQPIFTDIR